MPKQISLSKTEIKIQREADIIAVRQAVRSQSQECGFNSFSTSAIITAASELARNVWVHAKSGKFILSVIYRGRDLGIQLEFEDSGPGIADLDKALRGGYSTADSLGLGLSGTKRLADEFDIDTKLNQGTRVILRKWKK